MKAINAKLNIIDTLIAKGYNFDCDVHRLSISQYIELEELAKKVGYKTKPNNASNSANVGSRFFIHLQKIYAKNK